MITLENDVNAILNIIGNGKDNSCYIISETVRDLLLKNEIKVYHLLTNRTLYDVLIELRNIKSLEIHKENPLFISFSFLNKDYFLEYSKNDIEYYIKHNLAQRRLSIDTIAYNPYRHQLIDPYKGFSDLFKRNIRTAINSKEVIKNNPKIILEAYALAAQLKFRINQELADEIKENNEVIIKVNSDQKTDYLNTILTYDSHMLDRMQREGVLKHLIPELSELYKIKHKSYYHNNLGAHLSASAGEDEKLSVKWAALLSESKKPELSLKEITLSPKEKDGIVEIIKNKKSKINTNDKINEFVEKNSWEMLFDLYKLKVSLTAPLKREDILELRRELSKEIEFITSKYLEKLSR